MSRVNLVWWALLETGQDLNVIVMNHWLPTCKSIAYFYSSPPQMLVQDFILLNPEIGTIDMKACKYCNQQRVAGNRNILVSPEQD